MSRAYRIKVSESLSKIIKADDRVCTQLEILHVLPHDQMTELLAEELERRGFERKGGQLVREKDGIVVTIDPDEGTVSVSVAGEQDLELEAERVGWSADQGGKYEQQARAALKQQLKDELEREAGRQKEKLQSQITDRLEAHLDDLRQELNDVSNRVTAEALKRKAAQMGQIKQVTEDPQSGSMTIVLEV